jgi:S-DNA-T family DNA segregation ATPase FtsK/SpoIIIE
MQSLTATLWIALESYVRALWNTPIMARFRGAFMALLGLSGLISFLSYHADDPSLNVVTDNPVRNVLGSFGATIADMALQSLGLAAWPMAALMIYFGLMRTLSHDPDETRGKIRYLAFWGLVFTLALAAALSPVRTAPNSGLATSLGGFWGSGLHHLIKTLLDFMHLPQSVFVTSLVFSILAFHAFNQTLSLKFETYLRLYYRFAGLLSRTGVAKPLDGLAQTLRTKAEALKAAKSPPAQDVRPKKDTQISTRDLAVIDDDFDNDGDIIPEPNPAFSKVEPRVMETLAPRKPSERETKEAQPLFDFAKPGRFRLPELSILTKPKPRSNACDESALKQNARLLENVLGEFGVRGVIDQIRPGPVVTLYELVPAAGVKHSRVVALADDIARNMSARSCRVAVVQGRNAIGIELPNAHRETVWLRDLLASSEYERAGSTLPMALGETIGGEPYIADLSKMPHLLIAGTTGSGKSVGVNAMILSILYRLDPEQCKFIMIDPKMLELSVYDGIPHLLAPVVTDPKKAVVALKWTVKEMEDRYRRMSKIGVRNIASFNERAKEAIKKGENFVRKVQTGFDETGQPVFEIDEMVPDLMPYLVVVVDEVADLMMVAGKDIEGAVQRLAQMARAAGIHLIMATQRPSVDVITGTIKANFPTRISFQVTSKIDSRTILGEQGAEQLLGQGDMLYMAGGGRITRLHGPFCSDQEVEMVAQYLRSQGQPTYLDDVTYAADEEGDDGPSMGNSGDELYDKAVYFVTIERKASTSFIQRKLSIGYNRAASIMEKMEKEGVVGPANHVGKRDILVGPPAGI